MDAGSGGRTVLIHEYVTGGGLHGQDLPASWAAEGSAMRRALAADFAAVEGLEVWMTLDPRLPDEPGPWRVVRNPGLPAGFEGPGAPAYLVIAPETGGALDRATRAALNLGAFPLTSGLAAIRKAGDKGRLAGLLAEARVPAPATFVIEPGERPRWFTGDSGPIVCKPLDGAGSVDTLLVETPADWPVPDAPVVVQPYLPLVPMSASYLVGPDRRAHLVAMARQRVEVVEGRFRYLGGVVPAESWPDEALPRRALGLLYGLRGWVGVDFLFDPATGEVLILEINPRATTTVVGVLALLPPGLLARSWLAVVEGKAPEVDLAELVRGRAPVAFDADGTIQPAEVVR